MTVEGYIQFWLALCGGGLFVACAVAIACVVAIVKELRAFHTNLANLAGVRVALDRIAEALQPKPTLSIYNEATLKPKKAKQ